MLFAVSFITHHADFPKQLALFIPAFVLVSISFSAFGFFLGAVLPTTRAAQGVGIILFFLMLILGGAGPPREVLDTPMRIIGDATPVWYVIQLLQGTLAGQRLERGRLADCSWHYRSSDPAIGAIFPVGVRADFGLSTGTSSCE